MYKNTALAPTAIERKQRATSGGASTELVGRVDKMADPSGELLVRGRVERPSMVQIISYVTNLTPSL